MPPVLEAWNLNHWTSREVPTSVTFFPSLYQWPLDSKKINQETLKEINPVYSLKGLMLKLQYFGHLMQRIDLLEKTLMLGKIEAREGDDRE